MKRVIIMLSIAGILFPSLGTAGYQGAAWSDDYEVNSPIVTTDGAQYDLVVTEDGEEGAFLAWVDMRDGNPDIYAQRVDKDGESRWTTNGVPVATTAEDETSPKLVADGNGGVYVVWESTARDGNVVAQHLSASGEKLWQSSNVGVAAGTCLQDRPYVWADGTGGVVIAYRKGRRISGACTGVYQVGYARYTAGGEKRWRRKIFRPGTVGVTTLANDGPVLLVRAKSARRANMYRIYNSGQRSLLCRITIAVGSTFGEAKVIQELPRAKAVFEVNQPNGDVQIRLKGRESRFPAAGVTVTRGEYDHSRPRVTSVDDDLYGTLVTFLEHKGGVTELHAQQVIGRRRPLPTNGIRVGTGSEDERDHVMVRHGNGAFVVWVDEKDSSKGDLYAGFVNGDRNMDDWTEMPVSVRSGTQAYPQLVLSTRLNDTGVIVFWTDGTGSDRDIYAQRINADGELPSGSV